MRSLQKLIEKNKIEQERIERARKYADVTTEFYIGSQKFQNLTISPELKKNIQQAIYNESQRLTKENNPTKDKLNTIEMMLNA